MKAGSHRLRQKRWLWLLFAAWAAAVFVITLGSRGLFLLRNPAYVPGRYQNLIPFATLRALFAPSADLGYALLAIGGNLALFFPAGVLLPLLFPQRPPFKLVFCFAALTSGGIELLQYFIGRKMDCDDWLLNVAGALAGYVCLKLFVAVFQKRQAAGKGEKQ